ncbi:Hypothetical predicted protein [Cloeon dipterum]|uniref:Uncharacterized protein n=1 Tax=Cloeon dipterum TaxID=197152 RepID=A0A8S1E288_9INSE|nr:Hypothetical predicted protein [Cloeon dipterum]
MKPVRHVREFDVVMLRGDDPHLLSYKPERRKIRIQFGNGEQADVELTVGGPVKYLRILGDKFPHEFKLSNQPTRDELQVNNFSYKCEYGGQRIGIFWGERQEGVMLLGQRPEYHIDPSPCFHLCAGQVQMNFPSLGRSTTLYLDGEKQLADIGSGEQLVVRFINKCKRLTINGTLIKFQFGGPPFIISLNGREIEVSLSPLPEGVIPGIGRIPV